MKWKFQSIIDTGFILKVLIISHITIFSVFKVANAQLESSIGLISDHKIDSWYELSVDTFLIKSLSESIQPKDISFQFAIPVPVNLIPGNSGCIFKQGNENVWIIGIRSKTAKSLNLILEPFHVPSGTYVYIYDNEKRTIRGAFTNSNNNSSNLLPTMPVPGDEIILEYHFPDGADRIGTIGISQVAHDFIGILGSDEIKDGRFQQSQPCNVDINCPEGATYQVEKNSVSRLIIRGIELCTGAMINNTNQQNLPFLLTANHCITNQSDADRTIFVFGYESPWCKGPDGRVSHSLSGSVLRATNSNIDFTLVELSSFPPFVYKPYLAGWDISGAVPLQTVDIHHPEGDVKKISVDLNQPVTATFNNMVTNGYWKILQWDKGTTEGGSSGSPLFDQNKRIVGILTGGDAVCGRSVNDYFAKLSVTYNLSSNMFEQLKAWIDPAVSGVQFLNGRDPYAPDYLTVDTLSNIAPSENVSITKYTLPGTGYTTGFNSDSLTMYAEYFSNPAGRQISEVRLNIARANIVTSSDSVRIYVFNNGSVPGSILASQKIFINEARDSFVLKLDFNKTVSVQGNFYIGWKLWYGTKANSETRQFAVFHTSDRVDPDKNTAWFYNGSAWKPFLQHPFAPLSTSLDIRVVTTGNSAVNNIMKVDKLASGFLIFPNPTENLVIISSKNEDTAININLIDIAGNNLRSELIKGKFPGEISLDISGLKPGVYFVNISSAKLSESHKIIKTR